MPTPKRGTTADPKTADADGVSVSDTDPEETEGKSPYADVIDIGDERTTITFRDKKFSFPTSRAEWPTRAMQAFQKSLNADGVELVLGPKQWDLFNEVAPLMRDFWEFFPIFAVAGGFVKLDD